MAPGFGLKPVLSLCLPLQLKVGGGGKGAGSRVKHMHGVKEWDTGCRGEKGLGEARCWGAGTGEGKSGRGNRQQIGKAEAEGGKGKL